MSKSRLLSSLIHAATDKSSETPKVPSDELSSASPSLVLRPVPMRDPEADYSTNGASVWRTQQTQDVFEFEPGGNVSWIAWSQSGGYMPAFDLGTIAPPTTDVQVVSRAVDALDLFVIGFNGSVFWRYWDVGQGQWNPEGFIPIPPAATFDPSTQVVSVVSRSVDNIDLFAIGTDGVVRSTYWFDGEWAGGWFDIHSETVFDHATQGVFAVSRVQDAIQLYVLGADKTVFWWTTWTDAEGWDPAGWVRVQPTRLGRDLPSPFTIQEVPSAVSRSPDTIDLFATGSSDGAVWTTFWGEAKGWNPSGWFKVADLKAFDPASQGVTAISRAPDKLDLFVIGSDNIIYSTTWSEAEGWAPEWFSISAQNIFDHTTQKVTAISLREDDIEVFVVGTDNRVYVAAWSSLSGWQGFRPIPGAFFFDHTKHLVSAINRTTSNIDLFMVDYEGAVVSTFLLENGNGFAPNWFKVPGAGPAFDPAAPVSVISRAPDKLDLFVMSDDGIVWSTAWSEAAGWLGVWFEIGQTTFAGAPEPVFAISRSPDQIDLFVTQSSVSGSPVSGHVWSAHWDESVGWSTFNMYPNGDGLSLEPKVSVVSRSPGDIDLFILPLSGGVRTVSWTSTRGTWSPNGRLPILPEEVLTAPP
jgi:hypothetical protein